jgi:hypothetical protein
MVKDKTRMTVRSKALVFPDESGIPAPAPVPRVAAIPSHVQAGAGLGVIHRGGGRREVLGMEAHAGAGSGPVAAVAPAVGPVPPEWEDSADQDDHHQLKVSTGGTWDDPLVFVGERCFLVSGS